MSRIGLEKIYFSNDIFEREKHFLLNDFSDLQEVYESIPKEEKLKFCYLYKKRLHDILYEFEETIKIENIYYNNFRNFFYLSSLIEEYKSFIDYSFDFSLINEINSNNKTEKRQLRKIINSKIILVLINNFEQEKTQDEQILEEIDNIKKENKDIITNNIDILHEFDLNEINLKEIEGTKIDSLYIDIIKSLIIKNKLEDYDYVYNIINQLDFENIIITNQMFVELSYILNSNEPYLNFYKIKKIEDLFNKKIINFYFILFKYILKKEIFIYEIPWLLEVKKIIINAIKKKEKTLFSTNLNNNELIERKEYILKFITDSLYYYYYYKEYKDLIRENLNIILNYYQNYYFETKIDDIKSIKEIISTENGSYEKYFIELDIAKKLNDRYEIIKLINDEKYKDEKKESNLQESIKTWEKLEKIIKDKKIEQIESDYKKILSNYFKEEKNKEIFLKIFNRDIYLFFLYNISYEELQIIDYLFSKEDKDNNIQRKESELIKQIKYWKEIGKNIILKKLNKIKNFIIDKLIIYFKNEKNKEILAKIFTPESIIFLINYKDRQSDKEKLKEILQYYKQYHTETKKNDINIIEEIIKTNFENKIKYEDYKEYLKVYEDVKKMKIRAPIIKYIFDPKNEGISITKENISQWDNIEKMIKEKKVKKIKYNYKISLKAYFEKKENIEILLQIFSQEDIDFFLKEILKNNEGAKNIKNNNKKLNKSSIISNDDESNQLDIQKKKVNNIEPIKSSINNKSTKTQTEEYTNTKGKDNITNEIKIEDDKNIKEKDKIKNNIIKEEKEKDTIKKQEKKIIKEEKEKDTIKKQEKNIIKNILKKCRLKFNIYKQKDKNYIVLNEIKYGEKLIKLNSIWNKIFEKYKNYKNSSEKEKKDQILINFIKFIDFFDGFKNKIKDEFKLDYKLEIELNFESINNKEKNEIYNISCEYIFYPPLKNSEKIRIKDNNILFDDKINFTNNFQILLKEINDEKYIKKVTKKINSNSKSKINDSMQQNINYLNITKCEDKNKKSEQNNKYKIITFNNIIGTHKEDRNTCTAEFIKELSDYLVSSGTDKTINIYDKYDNDYKKKLTINEIKEWTYSINERKINNNTFQLIASSNKDLYLIELKYDGENDHLSPPNLLKYEFPNMTNVCCIELANGNYATVGLYSSYYFFNLFNRNSERVNHSPIIHNKTYRPAIKIKNNILALASNKVAVDGEDKLFFFNSNTKKTSNEIKGSFNFTVNGLSLITYESNNSQIKLLLCACKKYFPDQENGILLVNPQIEDCRQIDDPFCHTGDFEVYCFCPISIVENIVINENNKNDTKINNDFFFVGGFDNEKREGKIRLYKIIYTEDKFKTKIEYLQDIELYKENVNESNKFLKNRNNRLIFEGPINCIIQIKNEKNKENKKNRDKILATCYDGNVYSFSTPNLTFYKRIKNKK